MYCIGTDVAPQPQTKIGCLTPSLPRSVGRNTQLFAPAIMSTVTAYGPSSSTLWTGGSVPITAPPSGIAMPPSTTTGAPPDPVAPPEPVAPPDPVVPPDPAA